jgi:8-oxo-dGTP diphosphatase
VWRLAAAEGDSDVLGIEVVVVHRPKYDDWSFPKGKCDPGERDEDAALREVEEETGLRCQLGDELPPVEYVDGDRRRKVVRYWAMTVVSATPRSPDDEVDATRWLPAGEAQVLLTYDADRSVLESLLRVLDGV